MMSALGVGGDMLCIGQALLTPSWVGDEGSGLSDTSGIISKCKTSSQRPDRGPQDMGASLPSQSQSS